MTRRGYGLGSLIAFPFVLAATVAFAALGAATDPTSKPAPAPTPPPTASPTNFWAQQVKDAVDGLQAAQTALTSQPVTHQPLQTLLKDCHDRVDAYNATAKAAGPNWPTYIPNSKNSDQECKAPR